MNFLKLFLRGIAVLPSIVQGVESLYGARTGEQKRAAAIEMVGAAINVADAVTCSTVVDSAAFTAALGVIVDGVVACLNASIWHAGSLSAEPASSARCAVAE
jgi:hypothetical protein